jgi:hypothetical protein
MNQTQRICSRCGRTDIEFAADLKWGQWWRLDLGARTK